MCNFFDLNGNCHIFMINRMEAYLHACQSGCIYNCAPLALTQPLLCPNSIPLVFRKDVRNVLNVFWYLSEALLFGKIRAVMLSVEVVRL